MSSAVSVYQQQLVREIEQLPDEYLSHLVQLVRVYRESVTLKPAEDSFRQGMKESMAGETTPVSELWRQ
jgi:hypothetical protein